MGISHRKIYYIIYNYISSQVSPFFTFFGYDYLFALSRRLNKSDTLIRVGKWNVAKRKILRNDMFRQ